MKRFRTVYTVEKLSSLLSLVKRTQKGNRNDGRRWVYRIDINSLDNNESMTVIESMEISRAEIFAEDLYHHIYDKIDEKFRLKFEIIPEWFTDAVKDVFEESEVTFYKPKNEGK